MTTTPSPARHAIAQDAAEGAATVLRALAEPVRLRIVSAVAAAPTGRMPAGEIASITDLTAPTVSHHLRSLREAGVLVSERRGTWVYYALAPGMGQVTGTLLDSLAAAAARAGEASGEVDVDWGTPAGEQGPLRTDSVLTHAAERLQRRFPDAPSGLVLRLVRESYTGLARTARISQHLAVLAERFAMQRLEDISRAEADGIHRPQVLFVCVANAGRSQLAAALLAQHAGDAVVIRSAGSMPAADVHAAVKPHLDELLADPHDVAFPKPLTDDALRAADVVITMGCGDSCPVLPGKRYEDWPVGDPALASPAGVAAIRDDIEARVITLAAELTDQDRPTPAKENP